MKIGKCLELDENKNATREKLWDAAEAILRRKNMALKGHMKVKERLKINDLRVHC